MIDALQLPPHWRWATFGEIAEVASDLVDPTLTPDAIHIAPNHIESWTGKLLPFATVVEDGVTSPKHRFRIGQVLYSKIRPYLAKAAIATFDGVCSADMYPIDAKIDSRYLLHWILTPWFTGETARNQGRTILPKINRNALDRMPVPVPPLREQQRIAEKIEELFSDLDAGVAALERARANLKRYRASVLKAAVEGKLTAEWRAKHPKVEAASKLLERILKERRRKWEADQLAKFAAGAKQPPKDWQAKYIEPMPPDTSNLPELSGGWCWASVEQIGDVQLGRQRSPKNRSKDYPTKYIRAANLTEHGLDLSDVLEMDFTPSARDVYRLSAGDVLLSEASGSPDQVGKPVIWNDEIEDCCFQNTVIRLQPTHIGSQFLLVVFRHFYFNNVFAKVAAGVGINHLSAAKFSRLALRLPPSIEQNEIVAEVAQQLSQIEAADVAIEHGLSLAVRLRQSILKRAFEGKLVLQDPADEAASLLLTRIRQQDKAISRADGRPNKSRKLPKEVFLRRASVVSYAVRRLAANRSFGRTQLEKTVYLTQSHIGVDLGFQFERYVAGPFDKDIYRLEYAAKKNDWFTTLKRPKFGVTYCPGAKIDDMCRYALGYLGTKQADLDRLLVHIAGMNTDEAEVFATAYAAWNDLLIDGRSSTDDAIVDEVHGWHERKRRFTPAIIRARLRWMREHGYVPTGRGERTIPIKQKSGLRPPAKGAKKS